jgi:hypothetical protein
MPRTYKPTGNPPGRPRSIPKIMAKTGVTPEQIQNVKDAVDAMRTRRGLPRKIEVELPPMKALDVSAAADPAARAKLATSQLLDALHERAADMLTQLSIWEPEKALKIYTELMEFHIPKLARTEYVGDVAHKHEHFVGVEHRERDPRDVRGPDGKFLPVIEAEIVRDGDE